jgi:hypothetical protein
LLSAVFQTFNVSPELLVFSPELVVLIC